MRARLSGWVAGVLRRVGAGSRRGVAGRAERPSGYLAPRRVDCPRCGALPGDTCVRPACPYRWVD